MHKIFEGKVHHLPSLSIPLMSSMSVDIIPTCANCGKGEENSNKLKKCGACLSVQYCSRECQIAHRPQHKKECRERAAVLLYNQNWSRKRAARLGAQLYDEKLFKVPPKPEDCPICFVQMPSLCTGSKTVSCCGKTICSGGGGGVFSLFRVYVSTSGLLNVSGIFL